MKKNTLVTIISLLIVSTNHAQIINAGFENWTNGKPEGWEINSSSMVNRTNNSYSGSFAVKLSGENKIGSVSTAQLINGTSENFGTPVSQRHSSFNGWFKYIHTYYEKLELSVLMKKNGYIIGEGTIDTLPEATDYKQFTCFITYYSNEIPDTLVIVLKFTDYNISGVPTGAAAYFDDLSLEGLVDVKEIINNQSPPVYILKQNYPNPFNPTTKISWQSPVGSWQTLKVYDVLGNEVATLVDEYKPAGSYVVEFDGSKLSSGVYFYRIRAGEFVQTKKLILMK